MEIKERKRTKTFYDEADMDCEWVKSEKYNATVEWENGSLLWITVCENSAPKGVSIANKTHGKWGIWSLPGNYTVQEMREVFGELFDFLEYVDDHLDLENHRMMDDEKIPTKEVVRDKRGK